MKKFEVKTESEFKGNVNDTKNSKTLRNKIVDIVFSIVAVIAVILSGTILFIKIRYVACFVSGMSMYPTFNMTGVNSSGELFDPYDSSDSQNDGSLVDFLLADENKTFKNKIDRFDIVCSYYPSDYDSQGNLLSSASEKIKRVLGLPGETIWLVTSNEEGSKYCGTLYVSTDSRLSTADLEMGPVSLINAGYDIKKVDQPLTDDFYDEAMRYSLSSEIAKYNNGGFINYAYRWTLSGEVGSSEGEYILVGDNRKANCSRDSRSVGKIKDSYIQGKVIAVIGKGKIKDNGYNASFKYSTFKWRNF